MPDGRRRGLLIDFGGVLTSSIIDGFRAFCVREGLAPDALRGLFRDDYEARDLIVGLETGELSDAEFESGFAAAVGVDREGLLERLFVGVELDRTMVAAVAAVREAGIRTCLLSNSWGLGIYERAGRVLELFDATVISGEVGLRKPDRRIYELALARVGLPAEACVFVDDLPFNLDPARELGIAVVRHTGAEETLPELERLLGVPLTSALPPWPARSAPAR